MADYRGIGQRLSEILGLQRCPVAVTFRNTPPAGVRKWTCPRKSRPFGR